MYDLLGILCSYCIISPLILSLFLFQLFIIIIIKMSDMLGYCCLIYIYVYIFVYRAKKLLFCSFIFLVIFFFNFFFSTSTLLLYFFCVCMYVQLYVLYIHLFLLFFSLQSRPFSYFFLQLLMFLFSSCKYH